MAPFSTSIRKMFAKVFTRKNKRGHSPIFSKFRLESLEQREKLSDMDAADYRYAWAWVHFMMHGPESAHQALVHNIACYQQGSTPSSLSVELASTTPNPTEKMIQHFKHWQR